MAFPKITYSILCVCTMANSAHVSLEYQPADHTFISSNHHQKPFVTQAVDTYGTEATGSFSHSQYDIAMAQLNTRFDPSYYNHTSLLNYNHHLPAHTLTGFPNPYDFTRKKVNGQGSVSYKCASLGMSLISVFYNHAPWFQLHL
jgi:hypothetical protein